MVEHFVQDQLNVIAIHQAVAVGVAKRAAIAIDRQVRGVIGANVVDVGHAVAVIVAVIVAALIAYGVKDVGRAGVVFIDIVAEDSSHDRGVCRKRHRKAEVVRKASVGGDELCLLGPISSFTGKGVGRARSVAVVGRADQRRVSPHCDRDAEKIGVFAI